MISSGSLEALAKLYEVQRLPTADADVYAGDENWRGIEVPAGDKFAWRPDSSYVRRPPYFDGMTAEPDSAHDITGARHLPDGEEMSIFDASQRYLDEQVPLIVIAGAEYGSGSSRDWAAKGTALLGVKAVLAESFERIHRSNLIGMGVLPLQFDAGDTAESLGITGDGVFSITGLEGRDELPSEVTVRAGEGEGMKEFTAEVRVDTPAEEAYYIHGGILPYVLRQLL
ncbi:hypothetical protein ACPUD8_20335 [Brevibacterium sp. FAM 25378]|uniref:hypothetical protein n=1 Tax=Brevibacterium sp. FAM 25378 TaxID=3415682 RepID=UPI003C7CC2A8